MSTRNVVAALVACAALAAPSAALADDPPCGPGIAGTLTIVGKTFVATRADNGFGPNVTVPTDPSTQAPVAAIIDESFRWTATPPASVVAGDEMRLVAPQPGPVTLTAAWEEVPAHGPICTASGSVDVTVLPVRIPTVRREVTEVPLAIGPVLTWPCPDEPRAADGAPTIVVHYERGLARAPGESSPGTTLAFPEACQLNLNRKKVVPGVMTLFVGTFGSDQTRRGLATYPVRAGDLRMSIDVRWGDALVFHHEYAVVSTGRRRDDSRRVPVFLTTEPAAAKAAARRYARQRKGAPYVPPEQRAAVRSYKVSATGSYNVHWAGGYGTPGQPGCGYVREQGADSARFTIGSYDPTGPGAARGTLDRTYEQTRDCPPTTGKATGAGEAFQCPVHTRLGASVIGGIVPNGGLAADGRRAHGTRLVMILAGSLDDGGTCPSWGGLLFHIELDGSAARVARLHAGGRTTLHLSRTIDCREGVIEAAGDPTSCQVRVSVTARVRRVG